MAFIHLNDDKVVIRTVASSSRGGATTVRIELVVADPVDAGFIVADIQEQRRAAKATRAQGKEAKAATRAVARLLAAPPPRLARQLALPAPEADRG